MFFIVRSTTALMLTGVLGIQAIAPAIALPVNLTETPNDSQPGAHMEMPTTVQPEVQTNASPTSQPPTTPQPEPYRLSAGDRINVVVANIPEYSGTYQVLVDGTVDLPILGNVDLAGMTTKEASLAIAQGYATAQILVEPVVNVILAEANIVQIVIAGEVNRPGAYSLQPNNGELPTVSQAIEAAGGITQRADLQTIQVRRARHLAPPEVLQVSFWKLLSEGDISQNITLRDGDVVMLSPAAAIAPEIAEVAGSANVSPVSIQVNLVGEVNQAGLLQVPPNTSLNQALLSAGGFTNRARRSSVELMRLNPNGTITSRRVEIDLHDDVNDDTNPILHNRDVVLVGRSTLARFTDTLGTIFSTFGGTFSLFNLFSPFFGSSGSSR